MGVKHQLTYSLTYLHRQKTERKERKTGKKDNVRSATQAGYSLSERKKQKRKECLKKERKKSIYTQAGHGLSGKKKKKRKKGKKYA